MIWLKIPYFHKELQKLLIDWIVIVLLQSYYHQIQYHYDL